ncbi:hypothetical protein EPO04_00295 [Patescibacteria group bacterium]|nr:MAG: hypothetical protein EPO04_00295 [Patescibacteria group bacterium]
MPLLLRQLGTFMFGTWRRIAVSSTIIVVLYLTGIFYAIMVWLGDMLSHMVVSVIANLSLPLVAAALFVAACGAGYKAVKFW